MWLGAVACVIGFPLLLLSYSNHPIRTNIAAALILLGGPIAIINAMRSDRARERDTNDNGA